MAAVLESFGYPAGTGIPKRITRKQLSEDVTTKVLGDKGLTPEKLKAINANKKLIEAIATQAKGVPAPQEHPIATEYQKATEVAPQEHPIATEYQKATEVAPQEHPIATEYMSATVAAAPQKGVPLVAKQPVPIKPTGLPGQILSPEAQRTQATTDFAVNMPAPIVGPTAQPRGVGARLLDTAKKTGTGIATWAENPAIAKGLMTAGLTMLATPPRNVPYSNAEMIGRGGIAGLGAFEAEKEAERSRVELARKAGVEQEQLALKGREVATAEAQQKAAEANKQISIGQDIVSIPGGGVGYATISAKTGEKGYIPVPDWLITQLQNKGKEGGSEADITKTIISGVSGVMPELVKLYGDEEAQRISNKLGESLWNIALKTKYEGQKEETPGYFGKLFGKEEIPEIPNYIVPMEIGGIPKAPVAPPQGAKPILDAQGKQEIIDGFPAFQLLSGKYWTAKP